MRASVKTAALLCCGICAGIMYTNAMPSAYSLDSSGTDDENAAFSKDYPPTRIFDDRVEVKINDTIFTIPVSNDSKSNIYVDKCDWNFDGLIDLFVYTSNIDRRGDYWFRVKDKNEFRLAEEMAIDDGKGVGMWCEAETESLILTKNNSNLYFKWKDGKIVPQRLEVPMHQVNYSSNIINTYTFDSKGDIILEKRLPYCKIKDRYGKEEKVSGYIRVTDNAVEHMNGSSIVQIISIKDIFGSGVTRAKNYCIPGFKEDIYNISIARIDLDFDGTKDLCITLNARTEEDKNRYAYYLMNPKTGMYERSAILSDNGHKFVPDLFEKCLYYTTFEKKDDNTNETRFYKWENNEIVYYKREVRTKQTTEDNKIEYTVDVYRIDDNGSEYLSLT